MYYRLIGNRKGCFCAFCQAEGGLFDESGRDVEIRWTPVPSERIADFYRTDFNDEDWKSFPVPANWEINGYGTPIYVSAGYPFKIDPPRVMGEPKASYTTYKERNPWDNTAYFYFTGWVESGWADFSSF